LYYIYHYFIIHLDKVLKPCFYPTQRTHETQDHKRRSNAEPQRKRRSIIVISSVRRVDKNLWS